MFMADSARAAGTAREANIDAGLHLNLTAPFTAANCPAQLKEHQRKVVGYLRLHSMARIFYHPGLKKSFEYVTAAQFDEYERLFGQRTRRVDGHHHQHLCANVLFGDLLPSGTVARRNFTFFPGEKSGLNRFYRAVLDRRLARRHSIVDYLFALPPLEAGRLDRIFSVAQRSVVELETHPEVPNEYAFLMGEEMCRRSGEVNLKRFDSTFEAANAQGGRC